MDHAATARAGSAARRRSAWERAACPGDYYEALRNVNTKRFVIATRSPAPLPPPCFARRQVGADDVRVQLDAESGLVGDLDESIFYVWSVELEDLIHPAALAGNRLESDVIADGGGPLGRRVGADLAPGIVIGHRQAEHVGHVGD